MSKEFENLYLIDTFKKVVKSKKIEECSKFLAKENLSFEKNSKKIFSKVFDITKNQDSVESLLCLRCRVSDPIKNAISGLYKKHSSIYEIDYLNMMSYVLDDYGERYLKTYKDKTDKRKFNLIPSKQTIKEFEEWAKIFEDL